MRAMSANRPDFPDSGSPPMSRFFPTRERYLVPRPSLGPMGMGSQSETGDGSNALGQGVPPTLESGSGCCSRNVSAPGYDWITQEWRPSLLVTAPASLSTHSGSSGALAGYLMRTSVGRNLGRRRPSTRATRHRLHLRCFRTASGVAGAPVLLATVS